MIEIKLNLTIEDLVEMLASSRGTVLDCLYLQLRAKDEEFDSWCNSVDRRDYEEYEAREKRREKEEEARKDIRILTSEWEKKYNRQFRGDGG